MDDSTVKRILLEENFIEEISVESDRMFRDREYEFLIHCYLVVDADRIPIEVGVPISWEINLFDFYLRDNDDFPFMPHMEEDGKICIADMEGILIETEFEGLLVECFHRARKVLSDGLHKVNTHDFIEEFDAYWLRLKGCRQLKIGLPDSQRCSMIKCSIFESNKRKSLDYIYAEQPGMNLINTWGAGSNTIRNGLYIYINAEDFVYPPDYRKPLSDVYINEVLSQCDSDGLKTIQALQKKLPQEKTLVFAIRQPDGTLTSFGIYSRKATLKCTGESAEFESYKDLTPLNICRIDPHHLQLRTSSEKNPLENRKYLIIGCGSIGGYVSTFMVKAGCNDLTLVDGDTFSEENLYRHVLGKDSVGKYKDYALSKHLVNLAPLVTVNTRHDNIEAAVEEGSIDFNDFDVIIAATGNHNVNRWINQYIKDNNDSVTTIYVWNEPLDIGCHAAIVNPDLPGDIENLFGFDGKNELYDKSAYCSNTAPIVKTMSGCGGSFIPYGSEVSVQSALLVMDLLKKYETGRIEENYVVSVKGEGVYFREANLESTPFYNEQMSQIQENRLEDL